MRSSNRGNVANQLYVKKKELFSPGPAPLSTQTYVGAGVLDSLSDEGAESLRRPQQIRDIQDRLAHIDPLDRQ